MPMQEVSSRYRLKSAVKQQDAWKHRAIELLVFAIPVNGSALENPVPTSVVDRVADSGGVSASLAVWRDVVVSVANPF